MPAWDRCNRSLPSNDCRYKINGIVALRFPELQLHHIHAHLISHIELYSTLILFDFIELNIFQCHISVVGFWFFRNFGKQLLINFYIVDKISWSSGLLYFRMCAYRRVRGDTRRSEKLCLVLVSLLGSQSVHQGDKIFPRRYRRQGL